MPRHLSQKAWSHTLVAGLVFSLGLLAPGAQAGETDLADKPLANATTVDILPNIYFILDDSGSMDWDYMPDYVSNSDTNATSGLCRDYYFKYMSGSVKSDTLDKGLDPCRFGDAPYMTSAFNRVYYNPMIDYTPPVDHLGVPKTSYTTWNAVPFDGYGKQATGWNYPRGSNESNSGIGDSDDDWAHVFYPATGIDLTSQFPERVYCQNGDGTTKKGTTNCKSNISGSTYTYPDATYQYAKTIYGSPYYYNVTVEWCKTKSTATADYNFGKAGTCQARRDATFKYVRYTGWSRVDIKPSTTSYPGPNGSTRSYTEEMTNFANWFAWYRTRMQMTKTGVGQAFAKMRGTPNDADPLDKNYFHARVGFSTISEKGASNGSKFRAIIEFNTSERATWFSTLYNTVPSSSTPLRGALAKAGRIYAGKLGTDPLQYSCQRNFSILSTDGYWNSNNEDATYGPTKEDGSTTVGDLDGASSVTRPSLDELKKGDTLADVAYYYYHSDLRPGSCTLCVDNVPPAGTNTAVDDIATHQHMTTFTIGLGVDGRLAYQEGYKNSTSGDYYNILTGTGGTKWPDPISNSAEERIDDLWHAAVNGRGTYLSARDPATLVKGLTTALGAMGSSSGAGAAAATSNLHITPGDNSIFIANYRTVSWDGELASYTVDVSSGQISASPTWKAAGELDGLIGTAGNTDTRTIYTSTGSTLKDFKWASLSGAEQAYFDNTKLSQYPDWSPGDQAVATGELLVNYLRGHHRYEDQARDVSFGVYNRLYRDRLSTLGDIVHAQPVYVQKSYYDFEDAGYEAFKTSINGRAGTVYAASNDGMLHAFNSSDGKERWAYVPPQAMSQLWRLADKDYTTNHRFFVDGPLTVADVKDGNTWKTILIGALGKGGRGFYALDVTTPATPKLLWTLSADDEPNLGYSYAPPMVTKLDNQWVVLITSGYNNVPEGSKYPSANGKGYVFVRNAATGAAIKTISTGAGSVGAPSGLARINVYVDEFDTDNSAQYAYGGDLLGQMWRFDLKAGTTLKLADLGSNQPITAGPELGYNETSGKRVVFFGTGRYLGQDDLDDTVQQALYAIKDNDVLVAGSNLVEQTLSGSGTTTTVSTNAVDWTTKSGWFIKLPKSGERVHLDPQLYSGTVIFTTVIPEASACQPGGSSRVYLLSSATGSAVKSGSTTFQAVYEFNSPVVGISPVVLGNDALAFYPITADGKKPDLPINIAIGGGESSNPASGRRLMWRELSD